jgi:hypothetical protein
MAIHERVAVDLPRHVLIVKSAQKAEVGGLGRSAKPARDHVVELQANGGATEAAAVQGPLAFPVVARPDLALRLGADATRRRAPAFPRGLRSEAATFPMPGEEKVEPGLEDGLGRGPGMGVGEGIARGVELGEKSPRHGHVETAKVLGERDDLGRGRGRRESGLGPGGMVFNHMKRDIRVAPR